MSHPKSKGRHALLAAGSLLLGALLCLPAQAENGCGKSASLINPAAMAPPSGLGGTGVQAYQAPGGIGGTGIGKDGPSGMGGTGINQAGASGLGGTGIVGIITGFASICVNGVEVHFDDTTPVSDNGQVVTARRLAVGQIVSVRASGSGEEFSASNIALIHAVVGPIAAIDRSTGTVSVLGQTARAQRGEDLAGLAPGNWVRVSGLRLASGAIDASHFESIAPQAFAQIHGAVGRLDARLVTVEGTRVELGAAHSAQGLEPGREVLVTGVWDGRTLHAQNLAMEPTRSALGPVQKLMVEGYVQSANGSEISLGNTPFTLQRDVPMTGGTRSELAVNRHVQLTASVGADGQLHVEHIAFRSGNAGNARDLSLTKVVKEVQMKSLESKDDASSGGVKDSSGSSGSSGDSGSSGGTSGSGSSGGSGSSSGSGGSSGSGSSGGSGGSSGSGSSGGSGGSSGSGSSGGSSGSGSSGGAGSSGGSGKSGGGKK